MYPTPAAADNAGAGTPRKAMTLHRLAAMRAAALGMNRNVTRLQTGLSPQ